MPNYELAEAAEADLKSIALHTISKWGPKQAARYGATLDSHFEAIDRHRVERFERLAQRVSRSSFKQR